MGTRLEQISTISLEALYVIVSAKFSLSFPFNTTTAVAFKETERQNEAALEFFQFWIH